MFTKRKRHKNILRYTYIIPCLCFFSNFFLINWGLSKRFILANTALLSPFYYDRNLELRPFDTLILLRNKESLATLSRSNGAVYSSLLLRAMRILAERFLLYRKLLVSYKVKKMLTAFIAFNIFYHVCIKLFRHSPADRKF